MKNFKSIALALNEFCVRSRKVKYRMPFTPFNFRWIKSPFELRFGVERDLCYRLFSDDEHFWEILASIGLDGLLVQARV